MLLAPLALLIVALLAGVIWWSGAQGKAELASQMAAQASATGASLAPVQALLGSGYTISVTASDGGELAEVSGPHLGVGGLAFHVGASAWAPAEVPVKPT